jgi:hypothetical protein
MQQKSEAVTQSDATRVCSSQWLRERGLHFSPTNLSDEKKFLACVGNNNKYVLWQSMNI